MKRFKYFLLGAAISIALLGFGVSCDNDTTTNENTEVVDTDTTDTNDEEEPYLCTNDDLLFELEDDHYTVSCANSFAKAIDVPSEYNGIKVTAIKSYGFRSCIAKSIILPDTINKIGEYAFNYGVEELFNEYNNGYYIGTATNPYAYFIDYSGDTIVMHNSCVYMADSIVGMDAKSVVLSESLKEISAKAFYSNDEITEIEIPSNVERINYSAFEQCSNLTSVKLNEGLKEIGEAAFWGCSINEIDFPSSVEIIGDRAFSCNSLKAVEVPFSVKAVGTAAFSGNDLLEKAVVRADIAAIPHGMFSNCDNLLEVVLPNNILNIGPYAFYYCEKLNSVSFEETEGTKTADYKAICYKAFYYCDALEDFTIPEGIKYLENDCFAFAVLGNIVIPSSVETIMCGAFFDAELKTLNISEGVKIIEDNAFYAINVYKIHLPSTIEYIGSTILINSGLYVYYNGTAEDWSNVEKADDWITALGYGRLYLTDTNISLVCEESDINYYYLDEGYLADIGAIEATSITVPSTYNGLDVLYVEDNFESTATQYHTLTIPDTIKKIASYKSSHIIYNTYEGGNYIGTATNPYYAFISPIDESIETINLHADTKIIADYAFDNCNSLKSIDLPEGLKYIGTCAFSDCESLEQIVIPSTVLEIYNCAFKNCKNVTSLDIKANLTYISNGTFSGLKKLKSIALPDTVTRLENACFSSCESLESINLSNIEYIGHNAFYGCALKDVELPKAKILGMNVFAEGSALSITLSKNIEYIGFQTFQSCDNVTINYEGTIEEWNSIALPIIGYTNITVICSDGQITL